MLVVSEKGRTVVRTALRARARAQLSSVDAPAGTAAAVVTALKSATIGRPSAVERDWIRRIELLRQLLLSSPAPLELVDFGAGKGSVFDSGESLTAHTITRTLGEMTRSSKPKRAAYLLFRLMRDIKPVSCVELGSCVGISAAYQAAALALNGTGRLITLEGADALAARSSRTLEELDLDDIADVRLGHFDNTLPEALKELSLVDYAFIDGNHKENATLDYLELIYPVLAPEALLVFDDINWSDGMRRAWRRIASDERFALTVSLPGMGLAVVSANSVSHRAVSVDYH